MQPLLFIALAFVTSADAGLTDDELAKALAGQIPIRAESFTNARGKSAGRGVGAVVVERPIADVWTTLSRYDDRAEYVPRVKSVLVLDRQPARLRVKQEVDASVTTARFTAWYELDASTHTIHWTLDPTATDNTLVEVDGDYRMFELAPQRTLVVYRSYVDSGLHVPRMIQSYITKRSIPDLMKAIKQRVESGGTWRKK